MCLILMFFRIRIPVNLQKRSGLKQHIAACIKSLLSLANQHSKDNFSFSVRSLHLGSSNAWKEKKCREFHVLQRSGKIDLVVSVNRAVSIIYYI